MKRYIVYLNEDQFHYVRGKANADRTTPGKIIVSIVEEARAKYDEEWTRRRAKDLTRMVLSRAVVGKYLK